MEISSSSIVVFGLESGSRGGSVTLLDLASTVGGLVLHVGSSVGLLCTRSVLIPLNLRDYRE